MKYTDVIKKELETYYNYLQIEIEHIDVQKYNFYIGIPLTDFKNKDIIKSIQFEFNWDIKGSETSNLNQLKYKINKSIVKIFMKEGEKT